MTTQEYNQTKAFVELQQAKALINSALHTIGNGEGKIEKDIWELHEHADKVEDKFRHLVLDTIERDK